MIHLKYFKESLGSDELREVREVFQDLIDEWELYDLSQGEQPRLHPRVKYCKIEYFFFELDQLKIRNSYFDIMTNWCHIPFSYKEYILSGKTLLSEGISIYLNLAGPNDFYRIRMEFLRDLDNMVINRLKTIGFKCHLYEDSESCNRFVLNIKL